MTTGKNLSRRDFIKVAGVGLGAAALACGRGGEILNMTATSPPAGPTSDSGPAIGTSTPAGPRGRVITRNDLIPEQLNNIDTIVVLANFSSKRGDVLDFGKYWDRIFGTQDPIGQLNAYYNEIFYGQLQLRPVEIAPKKYIEVELDGSPQDYTFGWLIGMGTEDIAQFDPDAAEKLVLEITAKMVEQHPEIDYQDKYIIMVLNALGSEYGRGAAGVLPTAGLDPIYDVFIGNLAPADKDKFADPTYFRIVGDRVVGLIRKSGYTFDDYFRDRGDAAYDDKFFTGMAMFGKDGPLSCATHDVLHGLHRKSAYATLPEGRARAAICLYNLYFQSLWVVGNEAHGTFDRSINVSPHIGWWDPMADHLHPKSRDFFDSRPHGMTSFTRMRMGLIPQRCIVIAEQDDFTVNLAPLSDPTLPSPGANAEALVIKAPILPGVPQAAHIYLLLEYRRRPEGAHPDNFTIPSDYVFGDPKWDPGYNASNPAESRYVNPPTTFVSKEGVLVYLVNEKMPELSSPELQPSEWYKFILALLNPAGNDKRADLTQVPLAAGESMVVDCTKLYAEASAPVKLTITVTGLASDYAEVHITRENL